MFICYITHGNTSSSTPNSGCTKISKCTTLTPKVGALVKTREAAWRTPTRIRTAPRKPAVERGSTDFALIKWLISVRHSVFRWVRSSLPSLSSLTRLQHECAVTLTVGLPPRLFLSAPWSHINHEPTLYHCITVPVVPAPSPSSFFYMSYSRTPRTKSECGPQIPNW